MEEDYKTKAISFLKEYTGKKYIYLTQRGNKSILASLKIAKKKGAKKVVVQDQGGWITYLQYPEKLKMLLVKAQTEHGIIIPEKLMKELDKDSVFLVNSLSGYFAEQPMNLVSAVCKQKGAMLINDASGSIGTEAAKVGDIIIGSFGEGKPINMDYGGFIAFNDSSYFDNVIFDELIFDESKIRKLAKELEKLPQRLRMLEKTTEKIKKDLGKMKILHPEKRGINVVVAYKDSFEKEKVINYCNANNYEFTECPRYIRVNENAISIEVKRITGDEAQIYQENKR